MMASPNDVTRLVAEHNPKQQDRRAHAAQSLYTANREVFRKLIFFTLLMASCPVLTFFTVRDHIIPGHKYATMFGGFAAVFVTNIVVASYVIMAWREDLESTNSKNSNAARPKVGRFKLE